MSETQKQLIKDINNMIPYLDIKITQSIRNLIEAEIEQEIVRINPKVEFEDMDITEKIMLLKHITKTDEEIKKEKNDATSFEDILKEEGLTSDDL